MNADELVQTHVIQCVSSLIEGLVKVSNEVDYKLFRDAFDIDPDDLMSLCQSPDYESAARSFIEDDADILELEKIAEQNGDWDDVLSEVLPEITEIDDEGTTFYTYSGSSEQFEYEDEARKAAIAESIEQIREAVWKMTDNYEEVCSNYNLDYDYNETYEYWCVSDWLARKLSDKGESIAEVAGLTVWGRGTSGQVISIDSVIEAIAEEVK